jgi:hypothetical protein
MDDQGTNREGRLERGCLIAAFVAVALVASAFGYCIGTLNEHGMCNDDITRMRDRYEKQIKELESQKK